MICFIGIPVSIFTPQLLIMESTGESKVRWIAEIKLVNCQLSIRVSDVYHMYAKPASNIRFAPRKYVHTDAEWWSLPTASYGRSPSASMQVVTRRMVRVPLVYSVFLLGGVAWWIWRRNRCRTLAGHCSNCNYSLDGLESTTCPECGEDATP